MTNATRDESKLAHYVSREPFDPYSVESMTREQERYFMASQWRMMWWKLRRHHLAVEDFTCGYRHLRRPPHGDEFLTGRTEGPGNSHQQPGVCEQDLSVLLRGIGLAPVTPDVLASLD